MIKQLKIDNGRLGGIINTFAGSSYIFGIFTYINASAVVYSMIVKYYMPLYLYVAISMAVIVAYLAFQYVIVTPSQNRFIQNQAWEHGSPIRKELEEQREILARIEVKLNERNY